MQIIERVHAGFKVRLFDIIYYFLENIWEIFMYMNLKKLNHLKNKEVNQGAKLSYYVQNKFVSYFIGHMLLMEESLVNQEKLVVLLRRRR